jgi:hypothetical protein
MAIKVMIMHRQALRGDWSLMSENLWRCLLFGKPKSFG